MSLFHLFQSANTKFLLIRHSEFLNISSKCANACYRKNQVFLQYTINSKWGITNFSTLFLRLYQEKLATKFNKVSRWVLWVGDLTTAFFAKRHYLNLIFFKVPQSALLNIENKILLKKMQANKKLLERARNRKKKH